ncbi:hypothetical protein C0995_013457 [Termitomyces sp. Mi166|nr:hypothetical protein C0995_013457 [Termitomyces sp. Mi166\
MPRVLVTGVNGFVGSNVADEVVKAGYQVRGTLRGGTIENFKAAISHKFPSLEVVQVDDVATADLTDALQGIDAIIHVAVPLPFGGSGPKENLSIAVEGYVNVLRQAVKAGISKVVITGSWSATIDHWGDATEEEFLSGKHADNPMWIYAAAKTLGERAAWKFAANEPSLDLSIIIPPFIFGPYVPGFPLPAAQSALSSNQHIYALLTGVVPPPLPPLFCDVRDVARAHVSALNLPQATSNLEDKRFLICGGSLVWKDAIEYLHKARPELKDRIPAIDAPVLPFPGPPTTIDGSRAKMKLNMEKYRDWTEMLNDTVNSLLDAEKMWVKA